MEKIIGYTLDGQHNDTHMYEVLWPKERSYAEAVKSANPALKRCKGCGYRLDFQAHNQDYVLKQGKRKRDLSATYDGQAIVTRAFKDFCLEQGYAGVRFLEFRHDPEHFHLIVDNIVGFDAQRYGTRFENLCPVCRNYESVIGADPAYLLVSEPLFDGFFRTDLCFASGDEKHPVLLVGGETRRKLNKTPLRGLEFKPAYGL